MTENPDIPPPTVHPGVFERLCDFLAKASLVAIMLIIGGEVVVRNTLHYSWAGSDEISGYLVVAITFFSLATCQAYRGYHELQVVKGRLAPRHVALLDAALNIVCLVAALILLWQFARLVLASWNNQGVSTSELRIPFWVPQLAMPLGIAAFCVSLLKQIAADLDIARRSDDVRAIGEERGSR